MLPVLAVGVPVLLALAILLAQLLGGAALLPAIRRTLGGVGLRRRESEPISPTPEPEEPVNPEAPA